MSQKRAGVVFPYNMDILDAIKKYPKQQKHVQYGTAGFRDNISVPLQPIFVRVGVLGSIRSLGQSSKAVGIMVTASHNPEQDNGVKIIDHDGGMLAQSWEKYAEDLANAENDDFLTVIESIFNKTVSESTSLATTPPVVFIGRDTRPHSEMLLRCVELGIQSAGGIAVDMGEVTTPQLHYIVGISNQKHMKITNDTIPDVTVLKNQYYQDFANAYLTLIRTTIANTTINTNSNRDNLIVDTSNGVGSIALEQVLKCIKQSIDKSNTSYPRNYSNITMRNIARSGKVNDNCGAEHCQKQNQPPVGVDSINDQDELLCSFDGDADRIVFHSFLSNNNNSNNNNNTTTTNNNNSNESSWVLMDGDKIAALFVCFLQNELQHIMTPITNDISININTTIKNKLKRPLDDKEEVSSTSSSSGTTLQQAMSEIKLGVVQTAYANGSSTQFFLDRQVAVSMARTGVKHLHRKAHDCYDIGVYFEANGHGTILFSDKYLNIINSAMASLQDNDDETTVENSLSSSSSSSSAAAAYSSKQILAIRRLYATTQLVNQMIGDAISDMFLSIIALQILDMSIENWHNLYTDLPSKMIKVPVRDKNLIVCSEDETHVLSPSELQLALSAVMATSALAGTRGRCFVRPSGTEDVVRVYAEATDMQQVEELLESAVAAINKYVV